MDRRTFILLSVVATVAGFFGTAALAGGGPPFVSWPPAMEVADPEGWISEPSFDGRTAVWIEVGLGRSRPHPVHLMIRRLDRTNIEEVPLEVPEVDEEDPLGWLTGGPRVSGDTVVFSTRLVSGGGEATHALHAYSMATGQMRELAEGAGDRIVQDPAIRGRYVLWADGGSGDLDIWSYDLLKDTRVPVIQEPGDQYSPMLSNEWLVWLDGGPGGQGGEVHARRRAGGPVQVPNPGRMATAVALHGSRVAWSEADFRGSAVYVHDLERGEGGPLATMPDWIMPEPDSTRFGGVDLSDRWIVLSEGPARSFRTGAVTGGERPGQLLAYDAQAITSFHNLETYLTGYAVAEPSATLVDPMVDGFAVVWAEPDRDGTAHGGDRHLLRLLLARAVIFLPSVEKR